MIGGRYNWSDLRRGLNNPELLFDEFSYLLNRSHDALYRYKYSPGIDIMEEDWDNLILLDACRYDAFSETNFIEGDLQSRISRGSTSKEFVRENFAARELHDTVYITANPYVGLVGQDVFHAVITLLDEWDSENQTVEPSSVVRAVKRSYDSYSDKRLIIHFMQPHQPYLGTEASEIKSEIQKKAKHVGWNNEIRESHDHNVESLEGTNQLNAPTNATLEVTRDDVWKAYLETLEIVLGEVAELLEFLDGKSVISADHGELIGDCPYLLSEPQYGHPGRHWAPELRVVPWFVVDSSDRREITSAPPIRYDTLDEESLNSKLEALGYK